MNEFTMTVMHPTCSFLPEEGHLHTALWRLNNQAKKGTGLDCFGHCRCLFFCHSLQPVLSLFSDYLLFCLSVPPLTLSLPLLPEHGWPLGLASLSLCHVCNLNCGGAKQGWATRKAFHKTRSSLGGLSGSSVRNKTRLHILILFSALFTLILLHICVCLKH